MTDNNRKTYTVAEVAKLLGVNHKGVYAAISANRFPHIKLGRRILIPRIAFDRWLEEPQDSASAS